MAARALVDKGICGADPYDMQASLTAARSLLPSFLDASAISIVPAHIVSTLWQEIAASQFSLLTGSMLAGPYEKALITDVMRRKEGVHYTPRVVRRFVWNLVRQFITHWPREDRIILDPTCGSGGFLLTAYEGLAQIEKQSLLIDHDVDQFRRRLFGVDQDSFACDIARLALILQSNPIENGWNVQACKYETWKPYAERTPKVIIGNPPFGGTELTILAHSLEILEYGGIIALVLPRSFLTHSKAESTRLALSERTEILSVSELPVGIFDAQVSTCILVARKLSRGEVSPRRKYSYSELRPEITPQDRRRLFKLGQYEQITTQSDLEIDCFLNGELNLVDVWSRLGLHGRLGSIIDIRKGIGLRQHKNDPTADISDEPLMGYLPFIPDAKHYIDPFYLQVPKYIEWAPDKIYRPGKPEWWLPDKVLIPRHATDKHRWRLTACMDTGGVAYGERVLGGTIVDQKWTSAAVMCLLNSTIANAWYSTRSKVGHITKEILSMMPTPAADDGLIELLTGIGQALMGCAKWFREIDEEDIASLRTCSYLQRKLIKQVDIEFCKALGLSESDTVSIEEFMSADPFARPGYPTVSVECPPIIAGDIGADAHREPTTGIILSTSQVCHLSIVWLDGFHCGVPICIPSAKIDSQAVYPGLNVRVEATLGVDHVKDMNIGSVREMRIDGQTSRLLSHLPGNKD